MLCATCSDCATSVYYSAVYTSSDRDKKKKSIRGTERHTATFRHCTKQKKIVIITKSKDQAPNKVSTIDCKTHGRSVRNVTHRFLKSIFEAQSGRRQTLPSWLHVTPR